MKGMGVWGGSVCGAGGGEGAEGARGRTRVDARRGRVDWVATETCRCKREGGEGTECRGGVGGGEGGGGEIKGLSGRGGLGGGERGAVVGGGGGGGGGGGEGRRGGEGCIVSGESWVFILGLGCSAPAGS